MALNKTHVSLTVGQSFRLISDIPVVWSSNNPRIAVDENGNLTATEDALRPNGQAVITATPTGAGSVATCKVTIVSWMANRSSVSVLEHRPWGAHILGEYQGWVYYAWGTSLRRTSNSMATFETVGTLPGTSHTNTTEASQILFTPLGFFYRRHNVVYRSADLINWTTSFTLRHGGLGHSFDYYYDAIGNRVFVYVCEYTGWPALQNNHHALYRGVITPTTETWSKTLEFKPLSSWQNDPANNIFHAFHIHVVMVDPYTGHVWVGTGDNPDGCWIMYSSDNGETFKPFGWGSQEYRGLAFWFTQDYIYWNMDAASIAQYVFRIPRTAFANGEYPNINPELSAGQTKTGIRYQVLKDTTRQFPVGVGTSYNETTVRNLDTNHIVRPVKDPEYDYKQTVTKLDNGSHWFVSWAKDQNNENVLLMGSSPEGQIRDWLTRIIGFKEIGNDVDVQELFSVAGINPDVYDWQVRLENRWLQDKNGVIYVAGYCTRYNGVDHGLFLMRLDNWVNQEFSVVAPSISPPLITYFDGLYSITTRIQSAEDSLITTSYKTGFEWITMPAPVLLPGGTDSDGYWQTRSSIAAAPGTTIEFKTMVTKGAAAYESDIVSYTVPAPVIPVSYIEIQPVQPANPLRTCLLRGRLFNHLGQQVTPFTPQWSIISGQANLMINPDGSASVTPTSLQHVKVRCAYPEDPTINAEITIEVVPYSVFITPHSISVRPGQKIQMSAKVFDIAGDGVSNLGLSWSSSDIKIATVTPSGLVQAKAGGDVKIRADVVGGG